MTRLGVARAGQALGGGVEDLSRHVLEQKRGDDFGVDPTSGKVWVSGRQLVKMEQALEPFEDELDLPAQAVELKQVGGGKVAAFERGEKHDIAGGL